MKTLLTITLAYFSLFVNAQTLQLNNTNLEWTGKAAFNSYSLSGTLQTKSGAIVIDNNTIKTLAVTINMKSLNHDNKDLKKHLRSSDFFDVKTYTSATFTLIEPATIIDNKATIKGTMTIKGVSKTEILIVNIITSETETALKFETILDRTDYKVNFNSPSIFKKLKEQAIADDFTLKGHLVFN